jgi:starch synthase (maltosyl-transferring)
MPAAVRKEGDTVSADLPEELNRRIWIENVRPQLAAGRFPVKRIVGQSVKVTADIVTDSHDEIAGRLLFRTVGDEGWREAVLTALPDDLWGGEFVIEALQDHEYTVEAWIDRFATWRRALQKKAAVGRDVGSELVEGAALVDEAAARAAGADRESLREAAALLRGDTEQAARLAMAVGDRLRLLMDRHPDRSRATRHEPPLRVVTAPERALCGAWYEMFPRSAGIDAQAGQQLRAAMARLPEIAAMGFDVLYLPPIHPIGRTNRKGRNNALRTTPDDPGSPWAIGAAEGGHKAIHPDLGTLEDFDEFVAAAGRHGLEIALDVAFQCSPDHPYVKEHPEWFRHRPDGTIKCAENPPKTYEDIYPLDFENEDWRGLWQELRDVVLFWIGHGVRIFRVDNPHTKPIRFWQWLIGEVKSDDPEVIFLAEAFTRPKLMYALAKAGFDQSYTYFTWRNTKSELVSYASELFHSEVSDFFRPNFFTNTPDILPQYLQYGGRPAFQVRAVLAATLAAAYGIYSGYELCEARAMREGSEEYLDSEKYERRRWDWNQPGNIRELITRINAIRRENPALQRNDRLRFHPCDNEHIICYSKSTPDLDNIILVVVNLDTNHMQHGWVELPIAEYAIGPDDTFQVHDLVGEGRYLWHGPRNYVQLHPEIQPAQIFRLRRRVRTERDFDYFM